MPDSAAPVRESQAPSDWLKENALLLVEHHRQTCDGGCGVLLLGVWRLLEAAGFELTDDEKARLM